MVSFVHGVPGSRSVVVVVVVPVVVVADVVVAVVVVVVSVVVVSVVVVSVVVVNVVVVRVIVVVVTDVVVPYGLKPVNAAMSTRASSKERPRLISEPGAKTAPSKADASMLTNATASFKISLP